ncbi:hypothetical protein E2C01_036501 [Portunus trituberculatus]|uniref:Uncharacterized protein n=1 Tax=Portunus trituberculatus TaxID=210409 RepID=A0A5B7F5T0_PORTR|nr:hypothetical protein [Portunus trituberculatus]
MVNVNPSFSYRALHSFLKVYGTVLGIQHVYDKDFPSNRCFGFRTYSISGQLRFSDRTSPFCNIADSDTDYIPNLFDHLLDNSVSEVHQIPPPRWFVAYYRNVTQAKMLQHLPCPTDSIFETVKANPTFNNCSKGYVYSQDLYEFPEEEIQTMCPSSVHKVTKMRNSSNMVLLTFFGSTFPDHVHIGPIFSVSHATGMVMVKAPTRKLLDVVITQY